MNARFAVRIGILGGALVLAGTGVVSAQPAPPSKPAPGPKDSPTVAEAKRRFKQGVALAKAGNCAAAIAELRASFDLVPRTATLYNMGQCNEQLGRYAEAVAVYQRFLSLARPDDPDRRVVEAQLRSMRRLLGTIVVTSNVPAEVWLGNRKIGTAPGELMVSSGRHSVELRADGYVPVRREVELAGGQRVELAFTLSQAKVQVSVTQVQGRRGLPRYLFWTGVTATSGAALAGLAFGAYARRLHQDTLALDPRLPRDDTVDSINRSKTIADALFITAGVLAVGTTTAYFLTDWGRAAHVAPVADGRGVGIAAWGRF